jgi:adenylate kinase family enzyme
MNRVMIIGSPGTGKSTFAKKLAVKTGLPLIHLDYYYHDKSKDYYNETTAWQARVKQLTGEALWIIDGNYGKTMGERMKRADVIFYFDMPRRTALKGLAMRRLTARRTQRDDMPAGWIETSGLAFITYVWSFRKNYAAGTWELLNQNEDKQIIVLKSHKQVDEYLKTL